MLQKNHKFTNNNVQICGLIRVLFTDLTTFRKLPNLNNLKKYYPTKLIILPGTMIIFLGVFPASCAMVLSSASTIS